ncbi:MAG: sodium:proton antiporter [Acidimicrobiia bacterium]|nr:sodium:proton antiporter [Acidimicrobiia bacterium]
MSEFAGIATVAGVLVAYGLVSRRLATTPVSGPMIFVAAGVLLGPSALDVVDVRVESGALRTVAEATLVLVLYTDAIRVDLRRMRDQAQLPVRLLGVGLPLTIAAGAGTAAILFTDLDVWEAALVAAVLSPTDAALGQAVVTSERVPARVRQAINVESGLNDGLMVPVVTVLLALAGAGMSLAGPASWAGFAGHQIGLGLLVGAATGLAGGWVLDRAVGAGWVDGAFRQLATLGIGVGAFAVAELAGGNGFVAAFVAGIGFATAARDHCEHAHDFSEDEAHLLAMLTFLFFGAAMVGPYLDDLDWRIGIYAVLSLTAIRMVPVALALARSGLRLPTIGFIAWFGPRGIASVLFVLFVIEEAALPGAETIIATVSWTVLLSVVAHGATAYPFAERYGRWIERSETPREDEDVAIMPIRR